MWSRHRQECPTSSATCSSLTEAMWLNISHLVWFGGHQDADLRLTSPILFIAQVIPTCRPAHIPATHFFRGGADPPYMYIHLRALAYCFVQCVYRVLPNNHGNIVCSDLSILLYRVWSMILPIVLNRLWSIRCYLFFGIRCGLGTYLFWYWVLPKEYNLLFCIHRVCLGLIYWFVLSLFYSRILPIVLERKDWLYWLYQLLQLELSRFNVPSKRNLKATLCETIYSFSSKGVRGDPGNFSFLLHPLKKAILTCQKMIRQHRLLINQIFF